MPEEQKSKPPGDDVDWAGAALQPIPIKEARSKAAVDTISTPAASALKFGRVFVQIIS